MSLILFDVDGTLTDSGKQIDPEMVRMLEKISKCEGIKMGLVGGGSYEKISWQMDIFLPLFKYVFAECGAVVYIDGVLHSEKNMLDHCPRDILNKIISKAMSMISKMPIIFHGHQIDFRKGLVYIFSPGMQATDLERNFFIQADKIFHYKDHLIKGLMLADLNCEFEITYGGSVGISVYPTGWSKVQVVNTLRDMGVSDNLIYFGDRTEPGGNDYPIYSHDEVYGISVTDYHDTIQKLQIEILADINC